MEAVLWDRGSRYVVAVARDVLAPATIVDVESSLVAPLPRVPVGSIVSHSEADEWTEDTGPQAGEAVLLAAASPDPSVG